MYRGPSRHYKVVRNPEDEHAIWHVDALLLKEWRNTGRNGSVDECWDYIETSEGIQGYTFRLFGPG
jgi:uncharacterized protein YbdZ (MbtH family)